MPPDEVKSGGGQFDPHFWSLRNWKQIRWEEVSVDTLICNVPAFVFSLWIASNGSGEADGIIYDGHNAGVLNFIHIDTVDEAMAQLRWFPPLYFFQGIYIDVVTNVQQIGIQYLPEPR